MRINIVYSAIIIIAAVLSVFESSAQKRMTSPTVKKQLSESGSRDKAVVKALPYSPSAWWSMDDGDNSPDKNLYLLPGKSGNTLWLNGSNRLLGKIPGRFEQLSLSFWLKPARIHPKGNTLLASSGQAGSLRIRILSDTRLQVDINGLGEITSDAPFSQRYGWHHLAIVANIPAGLLRLFVDGRLAGEHQTGNSIPVSLEEMIIGSGSTDLIPPPMTDDNTQGLIDEMRIWSAVLSESDILKDMEAPFPPKPGLIANWNFDTMTEFPADSPEGYWGKRWQLGSDTDPLMRMARFEDASGGNHPLGMPFVRDHSPLQQSDLGGFPDHGDGMGVVMNRIPSPLPDLASNAADLLTGNFEFTEGVRGKALKFDGFTTCAVRHPSRMPDFGKGLSVEAWIAPQEYSLNQTAIINQYNPDRKAGFFFGLDSEGKLVLGAAIHGKWMEIVSDSVVPQLKWSHVTGVIEPKGNMAIYINGRKAGMLNTTGEFNPASNMVCVIGESMERMKARHDHNHPFCYGMVPRMVFDGLMDELKLYNRSLSANEVLAASTALIPSNPIPLNMRHLPELPKGPRPFGAYYTKLKYSPEWDALHRSGDYADVVVQFDNSPVKLVFWRGANYIPALVSENGLWMSDQAVEIAGPLGSCAEAIVDPQSRYSHVRVIENTAARVVVHWRCAMPRADLVLANEDQNGWNDWVDEYWTVYPDGVCVRKQVLMTSRVVLGIDFVETIMFNQPGMYPWETVEWNAITVGDLDGNQAEWVWSKEFGSPSHRPDWEQVSKALKSTSIQRINLRSQFKPFSIWFPNREAFPWGEGKAMFPYDCWNHWPVQQVQSDGINAILPDRPTHTSLNNAFWYLEPDDRPDSYKHKVLYGMTDQPFESLLPLARSWNYPANVILDTLSGFTSEGYDKYQRAFVFNCLNEGKSGLKITFSASEPSPVVNPSLVIKNWGSCGVKLYLNSEETPQGKNFRVGQVSTLEGSDLVVWLKYESTKPFTIVLERE